MGLFECYKWTNSQNGKAYIGWCNSGVWDKRRWKVHKNEAKKGITRAFPSAIRKYGPENFHGNLLATAETIEEIKETEIQMIAEHKTHVSEYGYNMTFGGDGGTGHHYNHTPESKKRMSIAKRSNPTRYWEGKEFPKEMRRKMSEAKKGKLGNGIIVIIDNKSYPSTSEASRKLNIPTSTITNRLNNRKFPTYKRCKK